MDKPYLLAGGLSAEKPQVLAMRKPQLIFSGVEQAPGEKDAAPMRAFVEAVRAA